MIEKITFWKSCQKYGISLWKCPTFLFIVMGATTISSMVGVYLLGEYYDNPELVIPIVLVVVFVTFVPGSIIVQSFEKVAESDLMKSEFVSIASHQLRSPLTALKWSLSFLLGDHAGELGEEQKRYLYLMRKNNEQMIMLVGDLLNVSRVDRGELVIKEKKIKIGDLVEERIEELRPMAESRNVELKLKNNTSEYVMGDEIYLGMVINNFTDNAIKYARDKNAKVVVHIFNKDNNVRYEVEDNGLGIPEDEQYRIFTKFFRSSNVTKHETSGTGLGLYIAKAVVEKLGGQIGFRSKEGEGTMFWFELPIIKK